MRKGIYAGECARSACKNPQANHFNNHDKRYYCGVCATAINQANPNYHKIYGHDLCRLGERKEDVK